MLDGDDDIDPSVLALAKSVRDRETALSRAQQTAADRRAGEKPLSEMTHDEKMQWLEKRQAQVKERRAKEAIESEKERELNRRDVGKAAQEVQEKLEMMRMKDAAALKRKEDAEKRVAMNRIKEKINADKERRRKEAEERAKEVEKIRAAKQGGGQQ